jgi:hypothetical protein
MDYNAGFLCRHTGSQGQRQAIGADSMKGLLASRGLLQIKGILREKLPLSVLATRFRGFHDTDLITQRS